MDTKKIEKYTKEKITEYMTKNIDEISLFKALGIYDSLTKQFNNMFELIEDWYATQNYTRYKKIRDNFKFINYLCEEDIEKDVYLSTQLKDSDINRIKSLAIIAKSIYSEKSKIENFIKKRSQKLYPNVVNITGPILALRLINLKKNIADFSRLPASTIQLIGAEDALFRHLKYNKKPPKYGILYEHPLMSGIKKSQRGKLARFIANKIAIASKLDYAKRKLDKKLYEEVEKKAKDLKGEKR